MTDNVQTQNPPATPPANPPAKNPPAKKKAAKKKKNRAKWLTEKFVPGQTKCRIQGCGHKVMVRSTTKEKTDTGKLRITRHVKCQGPNRHSFTLIEEIQLK